MRTLVDNFGISLDRSFCTPIDPSSWTKLNQGNTKQHDDPGPLSGRGNALLVSRQDLYKKWSRHDAG